MTKNLLITITFLLLTQFLKAQTSQPHNAQPDSVIKMVQIFGDGHTYNALTIGGKLATQQEVRIKLLAYDPSAIEVHKAITDITWTYISLVGFGASTSIAIADFAHHSGEKLVNDEPTHQHNSLTGAYIFTGAATAFLSATIYHFIRSAKHGQKALSIYNQRFE